jgi:aspartate kinase
VIVVKLGGTSLAGTDRMRATARIVAAHHRTQPVVCVVSAMAGVTDQLLRVVALATRGEMTYRDTLTTLCTQHEDVLAALTTTTLTTTATTVPTKPVAAGFATLWSALEADLTRLLASATATDAARQHAVAAFSGWGERLAVALFAAALAEAEMPTRAFAGEPVVLVERETQVTGEEGDADNPPWERLAPSVAATRAWIAPQIVPALGAGKVAVLPGYLARLRNGLVTTVGRNGSDYSAALVAAALAAERAYIYSDVAGIHRADPRIVADAELLHDLTYADAAEIALAGARVLHPGTLRPLAAARIPLSLRSFLRPDAPGTDIHPATLRTGAQPGRCAWVVTARPLSPERPLFGPESDWASGLVEVQGLYLRHADMTATEDDHLAPTPVSEVDAPGGHEPGDGPISGALALLNTAPRPVGLALSPRRISVAVPAAEATATQRRLYSALLHADSRMPRETADGDDTMPGEWRRTS